MPSCTPGQATAPPPNPKRLKVLCGETEPEQLSAPEHGVQLKAEVRHGPWKGKGLNASQHIEIRPLRPSPPRVLNAGRQT